MKIVVIGTGYVGLVAGTCFAEVGHHVVCVDQDQTKIAQLMRGELPVFEPGLEEKVKRNVAAHRLSFSSDCTLVVPGAQIVFLAVPTPPLDNGAADLSYVEKAARQVARCATGYTIIISKSTVPVGSSQLIKQWIQEEVDRRMTPLEFDVVANPEFLKQGAAVNDFMRPDRVIIGADNERSATIVRDLYAPFSISHDRILIMDPLSAEMTKYASNAMLATRISFMNDLAEICEKTGADVTKVRLGMGADYRIGYRFLYAGVGYGGSCFPKDVQALQATAKDHGCHLSILEAVHKVNEHQKHTLGKKIFSYFQGDLRNKTIAILGLSFKPETDDMRGAPSLTVIEQLLQAGALLRLYDPAAMSNAQLLLAHYPEIIWASSEEDATFGADALVLVTEWKQFLFLDFNQILSRMRGRAFFDGRNQYRPQEMAERGFDYISIGRPIYLAVSRDVETLEEKVYDSFTR